MNAHQGTIATTLAAARAEQDQAAANEAAIAIQYQNHKTEASQGEDVYQMRLRDKMNM